MTCGDEEFLRRARVMCAQKVPYPTRAAIQTYLRNAGHNGHFYKCAFCGHYHHTTYDKHRSRVFNRRLKRLLRSHYPDKEVS